MKKEPTPLFAARLKELRTRMQLPHGAEFTQSDLARAIGISPQAVQKWESGATIPREDKRKLLASALSTSLRELIRGTELEEGSDPDAAKDVNGGRVSLLRSAGAGAPKNESGFVPLISWAQAAVWGPKMGNLRPEEVQDWLRCPFDHGPNAFVLEVAGESNYDPGGAKSYAPGELIYVEPARQPTNRSMVVVRLDQEERAQLKQLLMDEGGPRLLKSLNPGWPAPVIVMPETARIVGVVIGKWVPE